VSRDSVRAGREEIFASWIGDPFAWQGQQTLHRLFAAAEPLNNE
jgi:hypothetical protein